MFRKAILLLAAGAALSSAAAAQPPESNRTLYSVNQPVVQRTDFALDLPAGGTRLSGADRARLDAWFRSLGVGYGDRVFVEENGAYPGLREDVARVAAEYGLLLSGGAPITSGAVQPGSVRVIVSRSTASVPGCPNWSSRWGASATSPNYGCSINSNIAAMVADPSDLVLGQSGSGTDGATGAKAIKVYRETPPTGSQGLKDISSRSSK
jgi:pilus assembly protein CpaD